MKKGFIFLIVFGSVLLATGGAIFGLAVAKKVFTNNSFSKEVSQEYVLDKTFNNINIDIVTADLTFKEAEDEKGKVVSIEREKIHHVVEISNDTLTIKEKDDRAWYEKWFSFFGKMKLTVYLPSSTYNELKVHVVTGDLLIEDNFTFNKQIINETTGDITIKNVSGETADINVTTGKINLDNYVLNENLKINVTTGDIKINNLESKNATINLTTGDLKMNNMIIEESLNIKTTNGDVDFTNCDANNIVIKTITGYVKGNFLTDKRFDAHATTGKVNVPNNNNDNPNCKINTTTGDIIISVGVQ